MDEGDFSEEEDKEAQETWRLCYNNRERLEYIKRHWRDFEQCHAKWYPADEAWRTLLANVRGECFSGSASELLALTNALEALVFADERALRFAYAAAVIEREEWNKRLAAIRAAEGGSRSA